MTLARVEPGLTGFSGAHGGHLAALAGDLSRVGR
jgi:hypothetical protein